MTSSSLPPPPPINAVTTTTTIACAGKNQHHQRPDCQSKVTRNQVCVLARHKLWRFFFGKTYQQRISRLRVVMKKIYNFPDKSELPKFILPVKISWLIFFCGFRGGNKNFADQSRLTFLSRVFAAQFRAHCYAARACAPMRACSRAPTTITSYITIGNHDNTTPEPQPPSLGLQPLPLLRPSHHCIMYQYNQHLYWNHQYHCLPFCYDVPQLH